MIKQIGIYTAIVCALTMTACEREGDMHACTDEEEFCTFVNNEDLNSTGPIIDSFLAGLEEGNDEGNLEKLREWLECKSCIETAEVLHISGISTFPAQSELSIDFLSDGQVLNKTMDVRMTEPLEFNGYHD